MCPLEILNGQLSTSCLRYVNEKCNFTCLDGYTSRNGTDELQCGQLGYWNENTSILCEGRYSTNDMRNVVSIHANWNPHATSILLCYRFIIYREWRSFIIIVLRLGATIWFFKGEFSTLQIWHNFNLIFMLKFFYTFSELICISEIKAWN